MKEPVQPLFLERHSYRRRRLIDAARVVDARFLRYRHLDLAQLQSQLQDAIEKTGLPSETRLQQGIKTISLALPA